MTDTKIHIQETQKTPKKISTKKSTPRPILLKLQKTKNKEEIKTNENWENQSLVDLPFIES